MNHNPEYARRDVVVAWLANQILRLASPRYRAMIEGSIRYGLRAAAQDAANQVAKDLANQDDRGPLER